MQYLSLLQVPRQGLVFVLLAITHTMCMAQLPVDPEAIERARRLAESPYRWIILADQIKSKRAGNIADAPTNPVGANPNLPASRTSNSRSSARVSAPVQTTARPTGTQIPSAVSTNTATSPLESVSPAQAAPTAGAAVPIANTVSVNNNSAAENVIFELFDAAEAKALSDGSIADLQGGFFLPTVFTYSEKRPNPVRAKFAYSEADKLVRFSYDVPEAVGYFGGAGVVRLHRG
ncbi:MAG: hypothetical protein HC765_01640 [Brachymonas sp.]|nr:hypothetical protein [Brachymonas sp.]